MASVMERLIQTLADHSQMKPEAAADQLHNLLHKILKGLREGKPVSVPGFGSFSPGKEHKFQGDRAHEKANRTARRAPRPSR
jgi:nucleoid DNA-binding protein